MSRFYNYNTLINNDEEQTRFRYYDGTEYSLSDTESHSSMPDLISENMTDTTTISTSSDYNCMACMEGLENQMAHYGGCLEDPFYSSADELKLDYSSNEEVSNDMIYGEDKNNEDSPVNETNDVLLNGHFLAGIIPNNNSSEVKYYIELAYNVFNMELKPGDWVFTKYHLADEVAECMNTKVFSWVGIHKVPQEHVEWLEKRQPGDVRYGLPVGEYFIQPKKNQFYGHPALYDPKTGKTMKMSKEQRKYRRNMYENNQLRANILENSFIGFRDYIYQ